MPKTTKPIEFFYRQNGTQYLCKGLAYDKNGLIDADVDSVFTPAGVDIIDVLNDFDVMDDISAEAYREAVRVFDCMTIED